MPISAYVYNLLNIRDEVFNAADWAPSRSTEAVHRMNQLINRALFRMVNDAPWLFETNNYKMALEPNVEPLTAATDLLRVAGGDSWVLETELTVGDATARAWETNRKWDGRILMVEDPDTSEMWHEFRIREVWQHVDIATASTRVRISLDSPWQHATTTGLNWRVVTTEMVIPEDVIELRSAVIQRSQLDYPLEVVGQDVAERSTITNRATNVVTGIPRWMYRREPQQLWQPNFAPLVTEGEDGSWIGPEPAGEFEYCFTYIWGKQESWLQFPGPKVQSAVAGDTDRYMPYWESAPSPVSNAEEVLLGGGALTITLPDIDFMMGFGDGGTTRYHRAGIKKRIYRRRKSQNLPGLGLLLTRLDLSDRFYLIGEADGSDLSWVDNGSQTPDYLTPLKNVQRYETLGFYPNPDQRYVVNLRAIVKPQPLVDDTDVPAIPSDAVDALIYRTLMYLYESQGNASFKESARMDYEHALHTLQKRHGGIRPASRTRRRKTAKVRRAGTYFSNEPLVVDV
jgi:hypothetical protein